MSEARVAAKLWARQDGRSGDWGEGGQRWKCLSGPGPLPTLYEHTLRWYIRASDGGEEELRRIVSIYEDSRGGSVGERDNNDKNTGEICQYLFA